MSGTRISQNDAEQNSDRKVSLSLQIVIANFAPQYSTNFVTVKPSGKNEKARSTAPLPPKSKPTSLVKPLYSYDTQNSDKLSFAVGDQSELINKGSHRCWHYSSFDVFEIAIFQLKG